MVWECPREGRTYRGYEIGIAKAFFVGYAFVACRRLYAGRRRTLLLASSAFMSALALRRSFSTAQMASRRTGQRERTDSVHCYALCATNRSAADWGQRRVTQFWVGFGYREAQECDCDGGCKHGRDFGRCIGANFGVPARSLVHFGAGGVGWLQTGITLFW